MSKRSQQERRRRPEQHTPDSHDTSHGQEAHSEHTGRGGIRRTCHLDLSQPDDVRPALKRLDEERVGDTQHDAWSEQEKKKKVITRKAETSVDRFPKLRL